MLRDPSSTYHSFLANKSAKRIFHVLKEERERGGERERAATVDRGVTMDQRFQLPARSTVYPFPLPSSVPVDFLKATRLARGYNSCRFGPRSTARTDVRVGIRLPFTERHERREREKANISEGAGTTGVSRCATGKV